MDGGRGIQTLSVKLKVNWGLKEMPLDGQLRVDACLSANRATP